MVRGNLKKNSVFTDINQIKVYPPPSYPIFDNLFFDKVYLIFFCFLPLRESFLWLNLKRRPTRNLRKDFIWMKLLFVYILYILTNFQFKLLVWVVYTLYPIWGISLMENWNDTKVSTFSFFKLYNTHLKLYFSYFLGFFSEHQIIVWI